MKKERKEKKTELSWLEQRLWRRFIQMMLRRGYSYIDVKRNDENESVEAITFSNNESYLEQVSKIE